MARIRDKTNQFLRKLPRKINQGLNEVGELGLERVRDLCPVDSGRLQRSFYKHVSKEGEQYKLSVGTPLDYATKVNAGERPGLGNRGAQFMERSAEYMYERSGQILKNRLREV